MCAHNISKADDSLIQSTVNSGRSTNEPRYSLSRTTSEMFLHTIQLKSIPQSFHELNISVLFTIGYVQDPIVQFASPTGLKEYLPLWKSYFATALEMIYFHYQDYSLSVNVSLALDAQIQSDAYKASNNSNYSAIVGLSTRQAIGG